MKNYHYDNTFGKGWNGGPGVCGGGSREEFCARDAARLRVVVELLSAGRSEPFRVLEIGCGDLLWHRQNLPPAAYTGIDIHERETWRDWRSRGVTLLECDAASPDVVLPRCDLVVARAVFPHLSERVIRAILAKLPTTTAKFLLCTSRPGADHKTRQPVGIDHTLHYYPVDLEAAPFALECLLPPHGTGLGLFRIPPVD